MITKIYQIIGISLLVLSVLLNLLFLYVKFTERIESEYKRGLTAGVEQGIDKSVAKIFEYYQDGKCKELPVSIGDRELTLLLKDCK